MSKTTHLASLQAGAYLPRFAGVGLIDRMVPVQAITSRVPRIPMSRLLKSIDFMTDTLIEICDEPIPASFWISGQWTGAITVSSDDLR